MAEIIGLPKGAKLKGRMGDFVFYMNGKKNIMRTIGHISKEKYRKARKYGAFRDNATEFGASSTLAAQLRRALHPYLNEWKTSRTSCELTGRIREAILLGRGKRGQRCFEVGHLGMLNGVGLNGNKVLWGTGKPFRLDRERGEVSIRVTYGKLRKLFGENELPLKLVLGVVAVSELRHDVVYKPLHPKWHGQRVFKSKKTISEWPAGGELRLKVGFKKKLPEGVGMIGVLGMVRMVRRGAGAQGLRAEDGGRRGSRQPSIQ